MKNFLSSLIMVLFLIPISAQEKFSLTSPDGSLVANIVVDKQLSYNIQFQGKEVLSSSPLSITTSEGVIWGNNPHLLSTSRKSVNQMVPSPFYRATELSDNYNQLVLRSDEHTSDLQSHSETSYAFCCSNIKVMCSLHI